MTRILLLLTCLLAVVVVISLPNQKAELKRGEVPPILPAVPVPQQWTMGMTAVGQTRGAAFAGTPSGGTARIAKTPVLARGLEHSNGDAPGLANVDAHAPVLLLNPTMKDETIVCGRAPLSDCGYVLKKGPFPLNLRRSGAGIALTISNTDIWIEPGGLKFSTSVKF